MGLVRGRGDRQLVTDGALPTRRFVWTSRSTVPRDLLLPFDFTFVKLV